MTGKQGEAITRKSSDGVKQKLGEGILNTPKSTGHAQARSCRVTIRGFGNASMIRFGDMIAYGTCIDERVVPRKAAWLLGRALARSRLRTP
jgi:hypothetical protein